MMTLLKYYKKSYWFTAVFIYVCIRLEGLYLNLVHVGAYFQGQNR